MRNWTLILMAATGMLCLACHSPEQPAQATTSAIHKKKPTSNLGEVDRTFQRPRPDRLDLCS